MYCPVHRRDRRPHGPQPPELSPDHDSHERPNLFASLQKEMVLAADLRQCRLGLGRAAEEEGGLEGVVLREGVGCPGLEVGAELASVAGSIGII